MSIPATLVPQGFCGPFTKVSEGLLRVALDTPPRRILSPGLSPSLGRRWTTGHRLAACSTAAAIWSTDPPGTGLPSIETVGVPVTPSLEDWSVTALTHFS